MKYSIRNLYLEVTRKCNLKCAHCMRGPQQDVMLTTEYVDTLFDKLNLKFVENITFGGGEPTLNPGVIAHTLDRMTRERIEPYIVGMITNGQVFSEEIADAFNRYAKERVERPGVFSFGEYVCDFAHIAFSVDKYHAPLNEEVRAKYREYCKWIRQEETDSANTNLIKGGYSKEGKEIPYVLNRPVYGRFGDDCINIEGDIYLAANGLVTNLATGEYAQVDALNLGHISTFSFEDYLREYGRTSETIAEPCGTSLVMRGPYER